MSYSDSLLASGERIVRRAHQHPFILAWRARWAVLAVALGLLFLVLRGATSGTGTAWDVLGWITLGLVVAGVLALAWGWLQYRNEEYVISSRRLIHLEGVINKRATDSSLEKINDAVLIETLAGRVFGFGDLDVLTASESGIDRLRMLRDAKAFKRAMLEAKHDLEIEITRPTSPPLRNRAAAPDPGPGGAWGPADAPAVQPSTPPPGSPASGPAVAPAMSAAEVTDALARLGDLRDRAIITSAEFEAKKEELLRRL